MKRTISPLTRRAALLGAGMLLYGSSGACQPVSVETQSGAGQVTLSWPAGLSLVQPQRTTNLAAGGWFDLGSPTTATNLMDTPGYGAAFYHLRFFAPDVTEEPADQDVTAGENASFTVTAVGTAPMAYQWRKGTAPLHEAVFGVLALESEPVDPRL